MKTLLIVGCGRLGIGLARVMHGDGYDCYGICRNPDRLPNFIHGIRADLTRKEDISNAFAKQHFDYIVMTLTAGQYKATAYQAIYERAVEHICNTLAHCAPKRLFFVSSSRVYGENTGAWINEQSVPEPHDFAGKSILKAEEILKRSRMPLTVLRLSGIYGSQSNVLLSLVREGRARLPQKPVYSNRIHMEDAVGFMAHLLSDEEPSPAQSLYLVTDSAPTPYVELLRWLSEQLGMTLPLEKKSVDQPCGANIRRRMRYNRRLSNKKMLASGYVLRYPDYRAGYSAIINTT